MESIKNKPARRAQPKPFTFPGATGPRRLPCAPHDPPSLEYRPMSSRDLDAFFDANGARLRNDLFEFLRIPSVSARTEHNADTRRAAEWLAGRLRAIGLQTA